MIMIIKILKIIFFVYFFIFLLQISPPVIIKYLLFQYNHEQKP